MEWISHPWLLAFVVLIGAQGYIADVPDASGVDQISWGAETTDGLGEEYPLVSQPATSDDTEALGEEFPE